MPHTNSSPSTPIQKKEQNKNRTLRLHDGRLIGFAEYGDLSGAPVFYFHGFPSSRLEASCFDAAAKANGYRVIGLDRPGMGLSSLDKNRTILSWAKDVAECADSLHIKKFSIVGHSGAGPFVAACAYAIPDRLNKVAIVSGLAPLEGPEAKEGIARGQRIVNSLVKAFPWITSLMMRLTRMMLKHPDKMMARVIKQLPEVDQAIFHDPKDFKAIMHHTLEAFKQGLAGPAQEMRLFVHPWGFDLADITCPVTIWHGVLDKQVPVSHAKIYERLLPNVSLNIIEDEGHHSLIRNQSEKILGFL